MDLTQKCVEASTFIAHKRRPIHPSDRPTQLREVLARRGSVNSSAWRSVVLATLSSNIRCGFSVFSLTLLFAVSEPEFARKFAYHRAFKGGRFVRKSFHLFVQIFGENLHTGLLIN